MATDTILVNLLRSVKSAHQRTRRRKLKVIANDQIINKLRNDSRVKRLERSLDIRLRLQNDVDLHLEDFHIFYIGLKESYIASMEDLTAIFLLLDRALLS